MNTNNIRLLIKRRSLTYTTVNTYEPVTYSISSKTRYKKYVRNHVCRALVSMMLSYATALFFLYVIIEKIGINNLFSVYNIMLLISVIFVFSVFTLVVIISIIGECNIYKLYERFKCEKISSVVLYKYSVMTQCWSQVIFLLLYVLGISRLIQDLNFPLSYVFLSIVIVMPIARVIGFIIGSLFVYFLSKKTDKEIKKTRTFSAKYAALTMVPLCAIMESSMGNEMYIVFCTILGLFGISYLGYQLYLTKVSFDLFKHNLLGFEKEPVMRKINAE